MNHEKELIIALRNGSHEAFKQLYDLYKRRVCSYIYSSLNSYDETEEVFQSIFEKLWENRLELDPQLSISAYIYKIAKNSVYDLVRQRNYRLLVEKRLKINASNDYNLFESTSSDNDFNCYLNSLIAKLPERRKEIFLLRYNDHLSYREIAAKLMISENTVDTQIRHAINFLRTHLSKELQLILIILTFWI